MGNTSITFSALATLFCVYVVTAAWRSRGVRPRMTRDKRSW